jgi:glycopeptide antibiotics resistance protein
MFFGFGRVPGIDYSYNLTPFATINHFLLDNNIQLQQRLINLVGNIAVFVPFGLLLPFLFEKRKYWKSFASFLSGLFVLETLQLLSKRGNFDIDDFLLNTIGFIIGYCIFQSRVEN